MSSPEDTTPASGASAFTTTQWTVVLAAGDTHNPQAAAALEHLCQLYWRPVYNLIPDLRAALSS